MELTAFDYIALAVIGISIILGLWRGAVTEVLALLGWVLAFWVGAHYAGALAGQLTHSIDNPSLRLMVAFGALFVLTLLGITLLRIALTGLLKNIGLGGLDRTLGIFVGAVKGMLFMLILVMLGGMTELPQQPMWRKAVSSHWFEALAVAVRPMLPEGIARRITFGPAIHSDRSRSERAGIGGARSTGTGVYLEVHEDAAHRATPVPVRV